VFNKGAAAKAARVKGGETAEIHGEPRNKPFLGVAKRSMETPARCFLTSWKRRGECCGKRWWSVQKQAASRCGTTKNLTVENSTRCFWGNAEILLWKCKGRGKAGRG